MEIPNFLTVEEAAQVLRIGRSAAYKQARRFLVTQGSEGLPVVRLGRSLRVPRVRLEALAGGPLTSGPMKSSGVGPSSGPIVHLRPASPAS